MLGLPLLSERQRFRVRVHPLLIAMVAVSVWAGYYLEVMTLLVLLVVHELGHITVAWSYGWKIRSLQLFPFGGVAEVEEEGYTPWWQEVAVALAGPFYHVPLLVIGLSAYYLLEKFELAHYGYTELLVYFVHCNVLLALFNLLPIHPLDGGRILQAVLSLFLPWHAARRWTAWLGMGGATVMVLCAFWLPAAGVSLHLVSVAVFLWVANWRSLREFPYAHIRFLLHRSHHGPPAEAKVRMLHPPLSMTVEAVLRGFYREQQHVLLLHTPRRAPMVVPERLLLHAYFQQGHSATILRDLYRLWYARRG